MTQELKRARSLIERCGWVGPEHEGIGALCLASDGRACLETEERVAAFSVNGALRAVRCQMGWSALEAVIAPRWAALDRFLERFALEVLSDDARLREYVRLCKAAAPEKTLEEWLRQPQRTTKDVLRAFVDAIARSKKLGRTT